MASKTTDAQANEAPKDETLNAGRDAQVEQDKPAETIQADAEATKNTKKSNTKATNVVNVDAAIEKRKTIGTDLQAIIRQRIKEA